MFEIGILGLRFLDLGFMELVAQKYTLAASSRRVQHVTAWHMCSLGSLQASPGRCVRRLRL